MGDTGFVTVACARTGLGTGIMAAVIVCIDGFVAVETADLHDATAVICARFLARRAFAGIGAAVAGRIDLSGPFRTV